MLNLIGRGFRNCDSFSDCYFQKRQICREEKAAQDVFKTLSLRNKENSLVYDFTSLSVRKMKDIFREDEEIRFSDFPYYRIVLKQNIDKERAKGTPFIIIKAEPRDNDVIRLADECGFRRISTASEYVMLQLALGANTNRE